MRQQCGDLKDHNVKFFTTNKVGKCPFCGISDLKGIHHTRREAYDHYLPKYRYPFNSINFHNLAPACNECNSAYKLSKDPVHSLEGRRKAFYPYSSVAHSIEISVDLAKPDIDKLEPADVHLTFGPIDITEEIETWREVYGIDERYKAKCCSPDAKDWLEEVRMLRDAHNVDPAEYLETLQGEAAVSLFANSKFLKTAFLEGCQRAGLLAALA